MIKEVNDDDFKEIKTYNSIEEWREAYANDIKEVEKKYGDSEVPSKIKFIIKIK